MGRCASVLNSDNFRKISAQRLANEMVDAESDILTFAIECFYFGEDNDAVRASKAKLLRTWEERATDLGVKLRETTAKSNIDSSLPSKPPGHTQFGHSIIGFISSASVRHCDAVSVTNLCLRFFVCLHIYSMNYYINNVHTCVHR